MTHKMEYDELILAGNGNRAINIHKWRMNAILRLHQVPPEYGTVVWLI